MFNEIKPDPDLFNKALTFCNKNDLSGCIKLLDNCEGDVLIYDLIGLCFYARGDFSQARMCWIKSIQLDENQVRAKEYLKDIDSKKFDIYIMIFNKGIDFIEKNKYISSIQYILAGNKIIPCVRGFNLTGLLLYRLGLKKNAIKLWKKSIEIDKGDIAASKYLENAEIGRLPFWVEKFILEMIKFAGKIKFVRYSWS